MEMVLFHIWSSEHHHATQEMVLDHLKYSFSLIAQDNPKSEKDMCIHMLYIYAIHMHVL